MPANSLLTINLNFLLTPYRVSDGLVLEIEQCNLKPSTTRSKDIEKGPLLLSHTSPLV